MARSPEQILERIKDLYPAIWVIRTLEDGLATYQGLAATLSQVEASVEAMIASTYVLQSQGNRVDHHGKGRGLVRGEGESDPKYQARIRSFEDRVTKPALEAGMNAQLATQGAYIDEHLRDGGFYDRQKIFADRGFHFYQDKFNFFTAWVPLQTESLLLDAFADRQQAFADRQNAFAETLQEIDAAIYRRIYQYLDRNRAAGVRFAMYIFTP